MLLASHNLKKSALMLFASGVGHGVHLGWLLIGFVCVLICVGWCWWMSIVVDWLTLTDVDSDAV